MRTKAYTLIEILIVISIMAIIVLVGYANYRSFARRQTSISYARILESDLRYAQELALSGKKPPLPDFNCQSPNSLSGIRFNMNTDSKYTITAVCSSGAESQPIKVVDLPTTVSMIRPSDKDVVFKTVAQGTDLSSDMVIKICALNVGTAVSLSPSGKINEYSANGCP
jgi:prepilin-type N-terminal cleavage/methylation domain-containing protein